MLLGNTTDSKNWLFGYLSSDDCFYLEELNVGRHLAVANGGNVGIGTTAPQAKLQIDDGALRFRNNADNKNWEFAYDAANDYFYLDEFGVGRHVYFANGGRVGIGSAPDTSSSAFRLRVAGLNGLHVRSAFPADNQPIAILAESPNADGGTGIIGTASTTYDVLTSPESVPLPAYGVRGEAYALLAVDLPGTSSVNTDAYGVHGQVEVDGPNPGQTGFYAGVFGGVTGTASTVNIYGVYSNGAFAATGTKAFQIDHPLDPENKVLNHYCAEGPEPLNIYTGNVVTDANGIAWVQLPEYFEAINRDPRYQLTVIGTFAQAIIGEELGASGAADGKGNRFSIRTSQPNVKVSWEVKAVRNDRFVQQAGAPVEVPKSGAQRGKYLTPSLYNQPREKSIFYSPAPSGSSRPQTTAARQDGTK